MGAQRELPPPEDTFPGMNPGGPLQDFTPLFIVHNCGIAHRELLPAVDISPGINASDPLQDFKALFMKYTIGI